MTPTSTDTIIPASFPSERHGRLAVFDITAEEVERIVLYLYRERQLPLLLITATDERNMERGFCIWYLFGVPGQSRFIAARLHLGDNEEFPSLAPLLHEAWTYERRIQTFFGLRAIGHPHPLPLILHENWPDDLYPLRKDFDWRMRPEIAAGDAYPFQKVEGEGIYEIPVGPVHAGIIEPGHFRFSVAGEEILHLEPRLGYTHKGSEKLFEQLPLPDKIRLSEKISGDSSFSHCLAFCQAIEEIGKTSVPVRANYLRVIFAELERLANHLGDLGAIMLDAGFSFGGSQCSRLREMIMLINELATGSRFLRGICTIGGLTGNITPEAIAAMTDKLPRIRDDFDEVIKIARDSTSLLNRLVTTGEVPMEIAREHGVVGIAAKARGITVDARSDYPYAAYGTLFSPTPFTETGGDVYDRFIARATEVPDSINMILKALSILPAGEIRQEPSAPPFPKSALAIGIVEGWRGNIVYFVETDATGEISRVAVRDPSFLNWTVLGYAAVGDIIPDFPLINKSFNLSYSGNDL